MHMPKIPKVVVMAFLASSVTLSPIMVHAAPLKAAVFDLELVDSTTDGTSDPQIERLKKASAELRKYLLDSGQVTIVDNTPQAAQIEKNLPLRNCHECDLDIAKALGADVEVTTALQKNSNLILSFSGSIKDVKTGKVLRTGVVAVRGNNDDMWTHGMKFLVKERLLDPALPESPEVLRTIADKNQ